MGGVHALVVLALVAAGCASKRHARPKPQASAVQSATPATYKPSPEPGILLPVDARMTATWKGKRVILAHHEGGGGCFGGPVRIAGIYVTEDGLVFAFEYQLPEDPREAATPCDIRQFKDGSPEWYACLHHDSKLRAKLEPSLLGALQADLGHVAAAERVELRQGGAGIGDSVLEVPGRVLEASALEIAWCKGGDASQLISPQATRIFAVFRRLRRAVARGWSFTFDCPRSRDEGKKEIAPGVLAWWSYED